MDAALFPDKSVVSVVFRDEFGRFQGGFVKVLGMMSRADIVEARMMFLCLAKLSKIIFLF